MTRYVRVLMVSNSSPSLMVLGRFALLRVSARIISLPFRYRTSMSWAKAHTSISWRHLGALSRGFFVILQSSLQSEQTVTWRPKVYRCHFSWANTIASIFSMVAYHVLVSLGALLAQVSGFPSCRSATPKPYPLASHWMESSFVQSKYVNTGACISRCFSSSKALSWTDSQVHSASGWVRSLISHVRSESLGRNLDKLFTVPLSLSTPALSLGGSIVRTASISDRSGFRPSCSLHGPRIGFLSIQSDTCLCSGRFQFHKQACSAVVLFISATSDEYIIGNAADSLKAFQHLVQPFLEDLTACCKTERKTAPSVTAKWSSKCGWQT